MFLRFPAGGPSASKWGGDCDTRAGLGLLTPGYFGLFSTPSNLALLRSGRSARQTQAGLPARLRFQRTTRLVSTAIRGF